MSAPLTPADRWGERLVRRLGLWSAVAVLVGSTIGSGIFRTPAGVAQRIDDVPLFLLAWVLGAIVVLCGALTYSELAAAFPRSGGVYVFVRESFGPLPAFLFCWAELWIIRPGAFGAIGITASAYTLRTLGADPAAALAVIGPIEIRAEQLLGAGFILLVGTVNYFGIHRGAGDGVRANVAAIADRVPVRVELAWVLEGAHIDDRRRAVAGIGGTGVIEKPRIAAQIERNRFGRVAVAVQVESIGQNRRVRRGVDTR